MVCERHYLFHHLLTFKWIVFHGEKWSKSGWKNNRMLVEKTANVSAESFIASSLFSSKLSCFKSRSFCMWAEHDDHCRTETSPDKLQCRLQISWVWELTLKGWIKWKKLEQSLEIWACYCMCSQCVWQDGLLSTNPQPSDVCVFTRANRVWLFSFQCHRA